MKPKVYLNGTENIGWAMDEEMEHVRKALEGKVEFTSLEDAEVVHSVYWWKLIQLPHASLLGKKVICSLSQKPYFEFSEPLFRPVPSLVNCLVAKSRQAIDELESVGVKCRHISYSVDSSKFKKEISESRKSELINLWNVPRDKYILGNFHRDSEGGNLSASKIQKGPEVLVEIARVLAKKGVPVHVLLAGPRRHWIRENLEDAGIGFTYVGELTPEEDNHINVLKREDLAELYHLIDCYVISSRWEGGPHSALEAAACNCKVISTPVGVTLDVLEADCIFDSISEGVEILRKDFESNILANTLPVQYARVQSKHTIAAIGEDIVSLYDEIGSLPENSCSVVNYLNRSHFVDRVLRKLPFGSSRRVRVYCENSGDLCSRYGWKPDQLHDSLVEEGLDVLNSDNGKCVLFTYCWNESDLVVASDSRKRIVWLPTCLIDELSEDSLGAVCDDSNMVVIVESSWALRSLYKRGIDIRGVVAMIPESISMLNTRFSNEHFCKRIVSDSSVDIDTCDLEHCSLEDTDWRDGDLYLANGDLNNREILINTLRLGIPTVYPKDAEDGEFTDYGGAAYTDSASIKIAINEVADNYNSYSRLIMTPRHEKLAARMSELIRSLDLDAS